MIQAIGFQRFLLVVILAVLAVGGYLLNSTVLSPQIAKQERQVRAEKSKLSKMTRDTNKLIEGIELFKKQKEIFSVVEKSGFFDDQNRVVARQRLDAIQRDSRLRTARYSISPAEDVTSPELKDAGYKILKSPIEFTLGAIDDSDIYRFTYLLNHGFPGQVVINNISMVKKQDLTQPLLRNIGLGADYDALISATISAEWHTMVPDTSVVLEDEGR